MQGKSRKATPQSIRERCKQLGLEVDVMRGRDRRIRYVISRSTGHCAFVCGTSSADRFLDGYTFAQFTEIKDEHVV